MEGQRRPRGQRGSGATTRGGRGGAQGRGRVRTPGGRGAGVGAGTAGLGAHRPSVSDSVTSGALQSFEEVHAMKRPLHESRRVLPPVRTVPEGSQSLWSSLRKMDATPSTSEEPLVCSAPPSPALYVECGGSGQSTPRITAAKRPANNDSTGKGEEVPASRRCLIPPTGGGASSSSSAVRARPLRDEEIAQILNNYGSEEDADSDDEDEDLIQPVQLPRRTQRLFMPEEETEVPHNMNAAIDLEWPPQLSSGLQPQPSAQPEPEPNAEPEPSVDLEATAEPYNKFDFRWRGFPESQIPPELIKEPFSEINCGPTVPLSSPYEAFIAIYKAPNHIGFYKKYLFCLPSHH